MAGIKIHIESFRHNFNTKIKKFIGKKTFRNSLPFHLSPNLTKYTFLTLVFSTPFDLFNGKQLMYTTQFFATVEVTRNCIEFKTSHAFLSLYCRSFVDETQWPTNSFHSSFFFFQFNANALYGGQIKRLMTLIKLYHLFIFMPRQISIFILEFL